MSETEMIFYQQRKDKIQNINSLIEEIVVKEINDLTRETTLGESSFKKTEPAFIEIISILKEFGSVSLDFSTENDLGSLLSILPQIKSRFGEVEAFTIATENPIGSRDSIHNAIVKLLGKLYEIRANILLIAAVKRGDIDEAAKKLEAVKNQFEEAIEENQRYIQTIREEINNILNEVRTAASQIGVAKHATIFNEQAKGHEAQANKWFIGTVIIGSITVLYAGFLLFASIFGWGIGDSSLMWQQIAAKFFVISVLSFVLVWAAKNYSSNMHNNIVNKHRQNALLTFETFIKGSENPETKDSVLLSATKCIFSHQYSGYSGHDAESSEQTNILGLIKSFANRTNTP